MRMADQRGMRGPFSSRVEQSLKLPNWTGERQGPKGCGGRHSSVYPGAGVARANRSRWRGRPAGNTRIGLCSHHMDLISFTRQLVDIESITGKEARAGEFLCAELSKLGFD